MSKVPELKLTPMDELFSTEEQRHQDKLERVQEIPVSALQPFQNHPFKVLQDEEFDRLCERIRERGVLSPLMARPLKNGSYEIVSGHRRKVAAELLGLEAVPVLVRDKSGVFLRRKLCLHRGLCPLHAFL